MRRKAPVRLGAANTALHVGGHAWAAPAVGMQLLITTLLPLLLTPRIRNLHHHLLWCNPPCLQLYISLYNTIWLFVFACVAYGVGSCLTGETARLPIVGDAADAQVP